MNCCDNNSSNTMLKLWGERGEARFFFKRHLFLFLNFWWKRYQTGMKVTHNLRKQSLSKPYGFFFASLKGCPILHEGSKYISKNKEVKQGKTQIFTLYWSDHKEQMSNTGSINWDFVSRELCVNFSESKT